MKGAWPVIWRRLLVLPVSLLVIVTFSFALLEMVPGDPAAAILGGFATEDDLSRMRTELGLDKALPERYWAFLTGAVAGDLGSSLYTGEPVLGSILDHLPATLELIIPALVLASLLGFLMGTVSAYYRGRRVDVASRGVVSFFQSTPDFFVGLVLVFFVFFVLGWAPSPVGRLPVGSAAPPDRTGFLYLDCILANDWSTLMDALSQGMLPTITLAIVYSTYFAKTTRSAMLAALESDQVDFARISGLPERKVLYYAFVDARTPMLTYGAMLLGMLLGGAAIIETVFAWGGLGQWALSGILSADMPVVQGFILLAGAATLVIYLALDVLVLFLDPRVRYR